MSPLEEAFQTNLSISTTGKNDDQETVAHVEQIVGSIAFPMTMQAAIELGLLEIIANAGPDSRLSASDIAAKLPSVNPQAPDMVDRILRLLSAFSVVSCSVIDDAGARKRVYGLTPVTKYFVKDEDGVSFAPLLGLLQDKVFLES